MAPGLGDGVGDRAEDGDAFDVLAFLARRDPGDDVRPVGAVAQPVEAALRAGQALDDEACLAVDQDRHQAGRAAQGDPVELEEAAVHAVGEQLARRLGVRARAASSVEPGLELDRDVEDAHLLDDEARAFEEGAPLGLAVVADVRGVAELLGRSSFSPSYIVSTTTTRFDATRPSSRVACAGSAKWCAATRVTARSKLRSAKGSSSAKQITSGRIPGAGSQLTTSSPASRSRRATCPPPVATSIAVWQPSAHSTIRSRSGPSACAALVRYSSARSLHGSLMPISRLPDWFPPASECLERC